MGKPRVIVGAVTAIVVVGFVAFLIARDTKRVDVATAAVTSGTIARQVLATGTLEAARTVDVGSQISGTLQSITVDFNSIVRPAQVIARLDPATYQSSLQAARGALEQACAQAAQADTVFRDAKTKFNRAQELAAQSLITTAELDDARATMQKAEADLHARQADIKMAQARTAQAEVDLSHTVIRSPIAGVVVNKNVDVGQTVTATIQSPVLFTIADLRKMNLLAEVNEGEVGGVRAGAPVSFQIESIGTEEFSGRVADVRLLPYSEQVATTGTTSGASGSSSSTTGTGGTTGGSSTSGSSSSTPTSTSSSSSTTATATSGNASTSTGPAAPGAVTYTAVIEVDNPQGRLTPGGTAIINLPGARRDNVVRIPNNALSFRPAPAVLAELGQTDVHDESAAAASADAKRRGAQVGHVWRYDPDKKRFIPLTVQVGVSDDTWTELVSGPVQPGDQLATSASLKNRF
jgi:RND family efflux transporter MFP subunit